MIAVLVGGGVGGGVIASRTAAEGPARSAPQCLRLAVPAYFDPEDGDGWPALATAGSNVAYVIMNPSSGPGDSPRPGFVEAADSARATGQTVLGYIATERGDRSLEDVRTEAARYREWYGVRDIFLDEVPTDADALPSYREYTQVVRDHGGTTVLNPGTMPDRGYFDIADIVVTFEDSARAHRRMPEPPDWLAGIDRDRIWHLVIEARAAELDEAMARAYDHHAGLVYVTDDELPNPWDRLPTYWERELELYPPGCRPTSGTPGTAHAPPGAPPEGTP